MENFGGEQLLPKFPADKIPVEKGVLEKESECEDELSPECGVVATDKNGEERHRKHGKDAKGVTELERLPEHFPLGNPLAKKSEQKGRRPKIGEGAENRVVVLENAEVGEGDVSQIPCGEIADKKSDPLDEKVYRRNENSDSDGTKCA